MCGATPESLMKPVIVGSPSWIFFWATIINKPHSPSRGQWQCCCQFFFSGPGRKGLHGAMVQMKGGWDQSGGFSSLHNSLNSYYLLIHLFFLRMCLVRVLKPPFRIGKPQCYRHRTLSLSPASPMTLWVVFFQSQVWPIAFPACPAGPNMPCQGCSEEGGWVRMGGGRRCQGWKFFIIACNNKSGPGGVI